MHRRDGGGVRRTVARWLVKYFLRHHPEIQHGIFPGITLVLLDSIRRATSREPAPRPVHERRCFSGRRPSRAGRPLDVRDGGSRRLAGVGQRLLPPAVRGAARRDPPADVVRLPPAPTPRGSRASRSSASACRGSLWRATGRPSARTSSRSRASLSSRGSCARASPCKLHLTVLALFAIPLVQTHATSALRRSPRERCARASSCSSRSRRSRARARRRAGDARARRALRGHRGEHEGAPPSARRARAGRSSVARASVDRRRPSREPSGVARVLTLSRSRRPPVVFATPLANLAAHGNPYYPLRLSVLGHALPGPEAPYASSPPWLARVPAPVRFACSLARDRDPSDDRRAPVDG